VHCCGIRVQQAFSRVCGFEPPLNFLGVENFKQLIQVREAAVCLGRGLGCSLGWGCVLVVLACI
jgi:hypothetical protein